MKKVVLLPLDERPCNYDFVYKLFQSEEIQLVRPEKLGSKKKAANPDEIREFLLEECKEAYGLILSVDMLLYGGLIPSRMHHETEEVLKELKKICPSIQTTTIELLCDKFNKNGTLDFSYKLNWFGVIYVEV
mgnify:CR=1 FL=1